MQIKEDTYKNTTDYDKLRADFTNVQPPKPSYVVLYGQKPLSN